LSGRRALYIKVDRRDTLAIARFLLGLLAVGALCATASRAAAQSGSGAITGVVTGDDGSRLPGVTVTVETEPWGRRTTTTDGDGAYVFDGLPGGRTYRVEATVAGFSSERQSIVLAANATLVVNLRLKLALSEVVGVTGTAPQAEHPVSELQQTIGDQLAHSLPLAGRNFIPLAMLAAGFTGNPNYPNPQGQQYWTNNVLVDGASHFSKWRSAPRAFYSGYGLESIRDVRVLTNRFSAEYGEAMATVTTAITRSGTDRIRGSALFFLQNDALDAAPVFAASAPPQDAERFGFTIGGPVVRERTHFFESYEGRRSRNHNIVFPTAAPDLERFVPDNEDEHLLFVRLDHRAADRHALSARYNGQRFRWRNQPGGLTRSGSGTMYRNDVQTVLASDRRVYTARGQNEIRGQFARYRDVRTDLNPSVFVSRAGVSQEGGTIGPYGYGADPEDTWEAADTFSLLAGDHALRAGAGARYVRARNTFLNYGRGAYFFGGSAADYPLPYLFVQGIAPDDAAVRADPRAAAASLFVQDDWRLRPSLTLNLGLRYDVESIGNVRNYTASADADNVQPRLGVAWDPIGSGRTIVRAGVGWYTQQHLLLYINRVQLEGAGGTATIALPPDSPLFPRFPAALGALPAALLPPGDRHVVAGDFRNPHSLQATVGAERRLGALTVAADYVYLAGHDLMSLVDANAPASIAKPSQRSVAQADATRPIAPVPGSFRNLIVLGNQGRSWYHALQIKAERSTGAVQLLGSYTLAHADDLANYQLPEDSRNVAAEKARANTDIRHNLSAGLSWQIPGAGRWRRDWTLSALGIVHSNRPFTIAWGDDRNGTTQNDARPGARNTAATGPYRTIDAALSRRFAVRAATIEGRVEAFNLLNAVNYDQYVGSLQSAFYLQPVSAFPRRRGQLAAVVRF
jgi:hypothetical protein